MIASRAALAAIAVVLLGSAGAHARIICRDGFQVVNGREISTPYCNDNYVAEVARSYGYSVTDAAVRNNPSLKNQICRRMGHDVRIHEYCDIDDGRDVGR